MRKIRIGGERGDLPGQDQPILAGESPIGALGSTAGDEGLALLRIDRLAEAQETGRPLTANGVAVIAESAPG